MCYVRRRLRIVAWYVESESGAKLARPELFRLLADAHEGDILLVEQVDRLSRLTAGDWERLKAELAARRPHVRGHQRHAPQYAGRGRPERL
jgi:DNA invertase Pin-like site-specific DNA recombinase